MNSPRFLSFVGCGGVAVLQALCFGPALAQSYAPQTIALQDNSGVGPQGMVCVIGSSIGATPAKPPGSPAAYYLTVPSSGTVGAWTKATGSVTVTAYRLGGQITAFATSPADQPYVKSGNLSFYVVKTPPAGFACSSIAYTMDINGNFMRPTLNYPVGLFEMTVWQTTVNGALKPVLTLDTSNVDSFETPLTISLYRGAQFPPAAYVAQLGNPLSQPGGAFTRRSMITGAGDAGGANSPFVAWLAAQPAGATQPALKFRNLALKAWNPAAPSTTSPQFPFSRLLSPNAYLNTQCLAKSPANGNIANIPSNCVLNGDLANWNDPLNAYFNAELATFFKNAFATKIVNGKTVTAYALTVMGDTGAPTPPDSTPRIEEQPWTVSGRTSCPAYLTRDNQSLLFSIRNAQGAITNSLVMCNPVGQMVTFADSAGKPVGLAASALHPKQNTPVGSVQTYTIDLTQDQYTRYKKYLNWYFGQPSSGWVGRITAFSADRDAYSMALDVMQGPSAANPQAQACRQAAVTPKPPSWQSTCPTPNPSFQQWVFSNIRWTSENKWAETASQMTFANDGAFGAWDYYGGNTVISKIARSIQRNVVNAFNRGVANCNNVTMNPANNFAIRTGLCATVKPIKLKADAGQNPANPYAPSDQYWANEANWYPAGGVQNYYAQYLHTARLSDGVTSGAGLQNIFLPPNNLSQPSSTSNQGIVMGMAYGYAFDESPVYIPATTPYGNVPSKLDPIPPAWFSSGALSATLSVGPYQ